MKLRKGVLWSLLWKHPFWLQPFTATLEDGLQLKTQFSKLLAINWYAYMGVLGAIVAQLAKLHLQEFVKDCQ